MSNIWHDISQERISPENFICVIEISKGSKKKYELDKETAVNEAEGKGEAINVISAAIES